MLGQRSFLSSHIILLQKPSGRHKMLHHGTQGYLQVMGMRNHRKKMQRSRQLGALPIVWLSSHSTTRFLMSSLQHHSKKNIATDWLQKQQNVNPCDEPGKMASTCWGKPKIFNVHSQLLMSILIFWQRKTISKVHYIQGYIMLLDEKEINSLSLTTEINVFLYYQSTNVKKSSPKIW